MKFLKNKKSDKIFWVDNAGEETGVWLFTFDKKKIYNMFQDYPYAMSPEEIETFDKENPFWAEFFADRKES